MNSIINYLFTLLILSSCNNSNNSELVSKSIDTIVVYKHDTINYGLPYACVAGVNNGEASRGELLNCSGVLLKNNSRGYKVVSFECRDIFNDIVYKKDNRVKNAGASFNQEIIKLIKWFDCEAKFCFEKIKVVGLKNDTVILNPVIIDVRCETVK